MIVIDFEKDMTVELKHTCFHHKDLPIFLLAVLTLLRNVKPLREREPKPRGKNYQENETTILVPKP